MKYIIFTIAIFINLIPLYETKIHDSIPVEKHNEISPIKLTQEPLATIPQYISPQPKKATMPTQNSSNERIAWDFFISKGYTKEQTAGILGNLQQEHNFNTSDVAGGLGIAQWIGGRRANLISRGNYTDINVQLQFLLDELNGAEHRANNMVKSSTTIEGATIAFQNGFERCGRCMQDQRIRYARIIYSRH